MKSTKQDLKNDTKTPKLRMRVFGSRADGTNRKNSDIDVLIEGSNSEIKKISESF